VAGEHLDRFPQRGQVSAQHHLNPSDDGLNLFIVGSFAQTGGNLCRLFHPLVVFGRTPLFCYLTHLFLYAGLGRWLAPGGTTIPQMIPYWLLGLLVLYPLCSWYGRLKHGHPSDSILRFF